MDDVEATLLEIVNVGSSAVRLVHVPVLRADLLVVRVQLIPQLLLVGPNIQLKLCLFCTF